MKSYETRGCYRDVNVDVDYDLRPDDYLDVDVDECPWLVAEACGSMMWA